MLNRVNLKHIIDLEFKYQVISIIIAFFILTLTTFYFVKLYSYHHMHDLLHRNNDLIAQYKEIIKNERTLQNDIVYFNKINDNQKYLTDLLVSEKNYPDFLALVLSNGEKRNVKFSSIEKDSTVLVENGLKTTHLTLHVTSSYDSLAQFISDFIKMSYMVSISSVQIPDQDRKGETPSDISITKAASVSASLSIIVYGNPDETNQIS